MHSRARCPSRIAGYGNGHFEMYVGHGIGEDNLTLRDAIINFMDILHSNVHIGIYAHTCTNTNPCIESQRGHKPISNSVMGFLEAPVFRG